MRYTTAPPGTWHQHFGALRKAWHFTTHCKPIGNTGGIVKEKEIKLMAKVKRDNVRENRIIDEIIVDAHDGEEQALSWYYYLEETIRFPFYAKCILKRAISPLRQLPHHLSYRNKKNIHSYDSTWPADITN